MKDYYTTADDFVPERALLVGVQLGQETDEEMGESLAELAALADTAGVEVVSTHVQRRQAPDPTYYIGSGKVETIAADVAAKQADLIIFDNELSAAQSRNLGRKCEVRALDRSGLILDIFANRARTREARLQVELAQLEYLLPRLTRQWTHLERQAGASGATGSVGLRGPGETQLETDRRLIMRRIVHLRRELAHVDRVRATQRAGREDIFRCALVGYTNAGKSTLLHALTGAEVFIEDRLFATLDSTTRAFDIAPNKHVVLTDTVGFIRKLPHHLVASFRSTLAEACEADMLLHVADCSHPAAAEQMATVREALDELDIHPPHVLLVMNKVDACANEDRPALLAGGQAYVAISATSGQGLDRLRASIAAFIEADMVEMDLRVPQANGRLVAEIHERGEVLSRRYEANDVILHARLRRADARAISSRLP